jgi:hypothetical protein
VLGGARLAAYADPGHAPVVGESQDEVVIVTSEHREPALEFPAADEASVEELGRRQGVQPVTSVEDMARPGLLDSDQEWDEFLADLYASRRADLA